MTATNGYQLVGRSDRNKRHYGFIKWTSKGNEIDGSFKKNKAFIREKLKPNDEFEEVKEWVWR